MREPSNHADEECHRRGRLRLKSYSLFGLDVEGPPTSAEEIFERSAPVALEIGSGAGEAAIASALAEPGVDLIAADVHTPGIARLLVDLCSHELTNLRVIHGDALEFIRDFRHQRLRNQGVVPDPWPKPRQRQRRLVTELIIGRLVPWIVDGGRLRMATDIDDYAEQMLAVCSAQNSMAASWLGP